MSEPLKPCPFCGRDPVEHKSHGGACETPGCPLEDLEHYVSREKWNRRTPGPATKAMLVLAARIVDCDTWSPETWSMCRKFLAEWSEEGE